eukprot:349688-Chlamydomonas_euryale.AAC.4
MVGDALFVMQMVQPFAGSVRRRGIIGGKGDTDEAHRKEELVDQHTPHVRGTGGRPAGTAAQITAVHALAVVASTAHAMCSHAVPVASAAQSIPVHSAAAACPHAGRAMRCACTKPGPPKGPPINVQSAFSFSSSCHCSCPQEAQSCMQTGVHGPCACMHIWSMHARIRDMQAVYIASMREQPREGAAAAG